MTVPPLLAGLLAAILSLPVLAEWQTYKIDNTHSFANWEIRHVVALTSGTFYDVQGKLVVESSDLAKSSVEATISLYSLNSSHMKRDVHLLSSDFLNARDYPEMKFVSSKISPLDSEKGTLTGQLTLHGVSKPVTLDYQILGVGKDPWGGMRMGIKATGQIRRSDFGIQKYVPYGPVGNEVNLTLLIEGIRLDANGQPWSAQAPAQNAKVMALPVLEVATQPVNAAPVATTVPTPSAPAVTAPAASMSTVVVPPPAQTPAVQDSKPDKPESLESQLKKRLLKELFN